MPSIHYMLLTVRKDSSSVCVASGIISCESIQFQHSLEDNCPIEVVALCTNWATFNFAIRSVGTRSNKYAFVDKWKFALDMLSVTRRSNTVTLKLEFQGIRCQWQSNGCNADDGTKYLNRWVIHNGVNYPCSQSVSVVILILGCYNDADDSHVSRSYPFWCRSVYQIILDLPGRK